MTGDSGDSARDRPTAAKGGARRTLPDEATTVPTAILRHDPLVLDIGDASVDAVAYEPGYRLGDTYEIECVIDRGGMGIVYRARHLGSGETVALKDLPPRAPEAWRDRLHEEAKLLARASHPNIARAHDVLVTAEGAPHLVMEYIDGETLAARLVRGPLPVDEAMETGWTIAEAIRAAHDVGVLHRDLKPGNVMITRDGHVKVLDFGLAMEWRGAPDPAVGRREGGTLGYMSPEQQRGAPQSERADVYAFGCVLHDCLVGFDASGPGSRDVGALPPSLPSNGRQLIERCLRSEPTERPRDMKAVCRTLGAMLRGKEGLPGTTDAPSGDDRDPLVGRDREVVRLAARVRSARAVTLVGPAGIGKTRLARAVFEETEFDFRHGSCFVALAGIQSAHRVPEAILQAIGLIRGGEHWNAEPALEHFLASRHFLLVLDDPGRVAEPCAEFVRRLLDACPGLHVLVTSRGPLGFPDEQSASVPPLRVPAPGLARGGRIRKSAAVRLFLLRAGWDIDRDDSSVDHGTLLAVAAICRCLAGNPFAIELAAARARDETVHTILERLREQASPEDAFELAIDALSDDGRKILGALRVFAGGFAVEHAVAFLRGRYEREEVVAVLDTLVNRQLLVDRRVGAEIRYEQPERLREFVLERCGSVFDEDTARDRHHAIFSSLLEKARTALARQQREWLGRLEQEHENILAALWWSERVTERDDPAVRGALIKGALRMAPALGLFWEMRRLTDTGRAALDRMLMLPGTTEFPEDLAVALNVAGNLAQRTGDLAAARSHFLEGLMICRAAGDEVGASRILNGLGVVAFDEGDLDDARARCRESADIKEKVGGERQLAIPLNNLARIALRLGEPAAARQELERARETWDTGDRHTCASVLNNLGIAELRLGRRAAAGRAFAEALSIRLDLDDRVAVTFSVDAAAELALRVGHTSMAAEWRGAADHMRSLFHAELSEGDRAMLEEVDRLGRKQLGDRRWDQCFREGRTRTWQTVVDELSALLQTTASVTQASAGAERVQSEVGRDGP